MTQPIPAARDLAAGITAILHAVTQLIFTRGPLFAALAIPLHNRIARASRRIAKLLASLADGTWRPSPHTPKPGQKGGAPAIYISRANAWLTRKLTHQLAGAYPLQLEFLLNSPQTQATIAAAPPEALKSLGRTLRPLARLLGVILPPELRLPPHEPNPNPPKPARPKPTPQPLLHPIYPQRRPRIIFYPDPPRRRNPA